MFSSASAANDNSVELIIGGGRRRSVRQCWATMRSNSPRDASNTAGAQKMALSEYMSLSGKAKSDSSDLQRT
jgi:hypothetical protein